ncbi:hypothetical protein [Acanthopleuribacter pedis]|uniref:Uncharacterized protein n=1 Tax=Acanthopleuribacter pedis TaxID=442870 RepID=A0A8J7QJW7_9BACT|nr:hypothetical protein [Acanthopleuribacter pedis]MBO1322256.1 hypothetical protein [Acanthopleuribacter pedis]
MDEQPSRLETRLAELIQRYQSAQQSNRELDREVHRQNLLIRELEAQCNSLRAQVDEMDKDRFLLKQMKDERKLAKRKLENALARLNALEQELLS